MNEQRSVSQEDYRLLYDKCQLAERMAEVGLPVVPLIGESADGSLDLKRIVAAHGPVFCKLRAGSRGESAFMATSGVTGLIGQTLAGKKLGSEAAVLAAWKTLVDKGPVLIQPYLRNHPLLQALSKDGDSLTLRVITRATASGFMVWTGFLYIPAPVESLEREYWVLKIDADTGLAFDAFGHWLGSESEITYSAPLLVLVGQALPFWPEIVNYSVQAHAEIPRLWSIAWDWIITPDGPILLEGNAGWDLSPLQDLGVDFVKIGVAASGNIYAERH